MPSQKHIASIEECAISKIKKTASNRYDKKREKSYKKSGFYLETLFQLSQPTE